MSVLDQIKGGLIVSCQAQEGDPLYGAHFMARMAKAAEIGGAVGIRANGAADIQAIKQTVSLPLIGIEKRHYPGFAPYITPTIEEVKRVIDAGADIVAIDATKRIKPGHLTTEAFVRQIRSHFPHVLLMADVSTLEEGVQAAALGFDLIATTLAGYTTHETQPDQPNFQLIAQLSRAVSVPVIAEGKIWTPEEAFKALALGAFAVVVGTAITRPQEITRRFTSYIQSHRGAVDVTGK